MQSGQPVAEIRAANLRFPVPGANAIHHSSNTAGDRTMLAQDCFHCACRKDVPVSVYLVHVSTKVTTLSLRCALSLKVVRDLWSVGALDVFSGNQGAPSADGSRDRIEIEASWVQRARKWLDIFHSVAWPWREVQPLPPSLQATMGSAVQVPAGLTSFQQHAAAKRCRMHPLGEEAPIERRRS